MVNPLKTSNNPTIPCNHQLIALDKPPYAAAWCYPTQEQVDGWLSKNTRNRPAKKQHIKALADCIRDGRWMPTSDAIAISASGVLLNGQNRLFAIRDAGYPKVALLVATGLPDESMAVIDRGITRTMRDILSLLLNDTISMKCVSGLGWWLKIRRNETESNGKTSDPNALVDLMENNTDIVQAIMPLCHKQRAPVIGALLEYASRCKEGAIEFAEQITTGENLRDGDPAFALRKILSSKTGGGYAIDQDVYSSTVSAIIKHASKKAVRALHRRETWEKYPKTKGRRGP